VEKWPDESEKNKAALAAGDGRNLQLMRRQSVHDASLTSEMAGELSRLTCEGENLLTGFRKDGDWSKIKAWYAHAVDLMRSVGEIKKNRLGMSSAYEALMDTFSPGLKDETVVSEFAHLEKVLPSMISETMARQALEPKTLDLPKTTKAQQEELCRRAAKAMCFDFNKGRMDMSDGHPWCTTASDDSRFTVDYIGDNFLKAVMTTAARTKQAKARLEPKALGRCRFCRKDRFCESLAFAGVLENIRRIGSFRLFLLFGGSLCEHI